MQGYGKSPPDYVQFLFLASLWDKPPWEIYNAWLDSGEVAWWIDKTLEVMRIQTKSDPDRVNRIIF